MGIPLIDNLKPLVIIETDPFVIYNQIAAIQATTHTVLETLGKEINTYKFLSAQIYLEADRNILTALNQTKIVYSDSITKRMQDFRNLQMQHLQKTVEFGQRAIEAFDNHTTRYTLENIAELQWGANEFYDRANKRFNSMF